MTALLSYQTGDDGIATIAMDDGKVNALSLALLSQLGSALDRAERERSAVILTGRAGTFCAGFDLRAFEAGPAATYELVRTGFELGARMLAFPRPLVIACSGHAIAMGAFLLLTGDYRVGVGGEYKIGTNEVAIGLPCTEFGVEMARQRLAPAYFHRALINAELFAPDEAVLAGFLDRTAPTAELQVLARAKASELAKLDARTFAATKHRVRRQALTAVAAAIEADAITHA
jgi:enoyl-CoA hydratase